MGRREPAGFQQRGVMWSTACWVLAAALFVPTGAAGQTPTIVEVRMEREGRPVVDPALLGLIETAVGKSLSPRDVRETIAHLNSLDAFEDIRVEQETLPGGGIRLRYVLVPAHLIDRIEFDGQPGVAERDLRRIVVDQFGAAPRATQAGPAQQALIRALRDRGYPLATVEPRIVETHDPDRATLIFTVNAGARANIEDVRITLADDPPQPGGLLEPLDVRRGEPYDKAEVDRALERWAGRMRARGHYEARASHGALFPPDGAVVSITLTQGPPIRVAFAGDPLDESDRNRLVPIQAEASADEDLLEDSARAIEAFLRSEGHRDARADFDRVAGEAGVVITFTVDRGPRYVIGAVRIAGVSAMPVAEVLTGLKLSEGDSFSEETLAAGVATVRNTYRARGYPRVQVQARQVVVAPERPSDPLRRLDIDMQVVEGVRTLVRNVSFEGHMTLSTEVLRGLVAMPPGQPLTELDVVTARDRIDIEYRNRGYDQIVVQSTVTLDDADTRADVRFTLSEGAQVLVDRVLIVGAVRTNPETIRRELLLRPGEPLGYAASLESRARLGALGLFRRVSIEEVPHGVEPRRDVVVRVEEAPATVVGGGGGVEGAFRLLTDPSGQAVEWFELAPRGFFELGRRNLWGKNRAVNLFTRVSLRNRDVGLTDEGLPAPETAANGYGFNEYRVVATFREPRIFGTDASVLMTGILEQAIRSSFNFARRELRTEAGLRLTPLLSMSGRYSFERTELFDEKFDETDATLIDRLFPQVRLSIVSSSFIRDSRDDLLDPSKGKLITLTGDVAARALGSEVGFVKTYVDAYSFFRMPTARRVVLAIGARLGTAKGFRREVPRVDDDGEPVLGPGGEQVVDVVEDLPASKRFFAGGDTTVRGFSLDRLGDAKTITAAGFPTGGNGLVILNGEMRVTMVGPLQAVGFLDAGNVVARVSELSLAGIRRTAGFGVRFRSPVGPIRLDIGFKLDRRELSPGNLERRSVWHISFGQAF